jgi:anti-sigma B factor antagonist
MRGLRWNEGGSCPMEFELREIPYMEIKMNDESETKTVAPSGEVDMSSSVKLREVLQRLVKKKIPKLVVNLEEVSYIDSSGLATLVECMQEMKKYGGEMKIVVTKKAILDVFQLARLDRVFRISPS